MFAALWKGKQTPRLLKTPTGVRTHERSQYKCHGHPINWGRGPKEMLLKTF